MHTPSLEEFELEDLSSDDLMTDEQLAEHAMRDSDQEEDSQELEAQFEDESDNADATSDTSDVSPHPRQRDELDKLLLTLEQLIGILAKSAKQTESLSVPAAKQFAKAIHYVKQENNHYLGAKWFRKAAIQGHPKAQLYLGLMFLKGEGLPKSFFHAYSWLSIAACQDVAEAKEALMKLEPHLTAKQMQSALKHAADVMEIILGQG